MGRAVSAQIFHFRLGQHQIEFAFDLGLFVKGCFRLFQPGLNSPNAVKGIVLGAFQDRKSVV